MELVSIFLISPIWGSLSPRLFLRAWLSFLGIIGCGIHRKRGQITTRECTGHLFQFATELLFNGLLLFSGFYIFYILLPLGRSGPEVFTFWLATTVQLLYLLPQLGNEVDAIWQRPLTGAQEKEKTQPAVDDLYLN